MPGLDITQISSNWKILQARLKSGKDGNDTLKRKRASKDEGSSKVTKRARPDKTISRARTKPRNMGSMLSSEPQTVDAAIASHSDLLTKHDISKNDLSAAYGGFFELGSKDVVNDGRRSTNKPGRYLALDCEMVGTGPPPHTDDVLARVSIVNFHGEQIYDSYVQAPAGVKVQDYRTHVSGIEQHHMRQGTARSFSEVQKEVMGLLDGKILVGHALKKDLQVLQYSHPVRDTRDTSRHKTFRVESRGKPPALRNLAKQHLGVVIQGGAHSSLEDARATMMLYKKEKVAFEAEARRVHGAPRASRPAPAGPVQQEPSDDGLEDEEEDDLDEDDEPVDSVMQSTTLTKPKKKHNKKKKRTKR